MQQTSFSNKDILFANTPRPCRRCGLVSNQYYFATDKGEGGGYLCPKCKYELTPPQMFLQIVQNYIHPHGAVFSPLGQIFETVLDLEDFQKCGWFIKKRWIHGKINPDKIRTKSHVVEVMHLLYYGDRRCKRVERYEFWPVGYQRCNCIYCDRR